LEIRNQRTNCVDIENSTGKRLIPFRVRSTIALLWLNGGRPTALSPTRTPPVAFHLSRLSRGDSCMKWKPPERLPSPAG